MAAAANCFMMRSNLDMLTRDVLTVTGNPLIILDTSVLLGGAILLYS